METDDQDNAIGKKKHTTSIYKKNLESSNKSFNISDIMPLSKKEDDSLPSSSILDFSKMTVQQFFVKSLNKSK